MISSVCIFEDNTHHTLKPLNFARAVYDLRVGFDTLFDKIVAAFPDARQYACCRKEVEAFVQHNHPGLLVNKINKGAPTLFINGKVVMNKELKQMLDDIDLSQNALFTHKNKVVAVYARGESLQVMDLCLKTTLVASDIIKYFRNCSVCKEIPELTLIEYPWDLIENNDQCLKWDFLRYNQPGIIKGQLHPFTVVYNEHAVFVDEESFVEDFVILDARKGPIYIEKGVVIKAHSRLQGPLYIGRHSQILSALIGNASIGPYCKIAGEITNSVFQGFSNKAHFGFIGHSYVGQWVNLGAGTTTSNLKANYNPIKMSVNGHTKQMNQLGSIICDHVKTSIGTLLNTGTQVGFGSVLLDTVLHQKEIPFFSWGKAGEYQRVKLDAFLNTAQKMMQRRNQVMPDSIVQSIVKKYELEFNVLASL